jgi:hypothetical protein
MKLITKEQRAKLIANGKQTSLDGDGRYHKPVVKLFLPGSGATWLLSELDPDDPTIAFGLCDLGLGETELGYVSITELESVRSRMGLKVERDLYFEADKTISEYADAARSLGYISA